MIRRRVSFDCDYPGCDIHADGRPSEPSIVEFPWELPARWSIVKIQTEHYGSYAIRYFCPTHTEFVVGER